MGFYIYNEILFSNMKGQKPVMATYMNLWDMRISEMSQAQKARLHVLTHMGNHESREESGGYQRLGWGGGWEQLLAGAES